MKARIEFSIDEATHRLNEQMAEQQYKVSSHDAWLTEQVKQAFTKLDSGQAVFVEHDKAQLLIEERKAKFRNTSY